MGQPEYLYPQMLQAADGTDLAFGNTANYGKQHPSYVQQELNTRVGVGDSTTIKKLEVSNDVVYGKVIRGVGGGCLTNLYCPGVRDPDYSH